MRSHTTWALAHLKGQGRLVGAIPYGSRLAADGLHLEPEPAEQLVIAEAKRLRAAGLSLAKVGERLAAAGMKARNGRAFLGTQVARMVA